MVRTFDACEASIGLIVKQFAQKIKEYQISDKLRREYALLIEELTTKIVLAAEPGAKITLQINRRLGKVFAKIHCPGTPVFLESESGTDYSGQIIREYSEHVRQSYSFGANEILFTTSFSSNEILFRDLIASGLAVLCGLLFRFLCNPEQLGWVSNNLTLPIIMIFVRGMQTVAVPVAFFSLAYFVVNIRRTFDRDNKTIRLGFRYMVSSIFAIGIGALSRSLFFGFAPHYDLSGFQMEADNFIGLTIGELLSQVVSSNMIEPFLLSNPIPVLVNALLLGFAASSVFGKAGDTVRNGLEAMNDLFSRMMNIIYGIIPFFLFFAVFDFTVKADGEMLRMFGFELIYVFAAMALLLLFYLVRLILGGVKPISFFKNYAKLLLDNFIIASNIDSYPCNKRILVKKTGLSKEYLAEGLKLGILLNMDGNCLVVSVFLTSLISCVGAELSAMKYVGVAIVLFLFSVGAPNSPGSLLIGMIILMSFIGVSTELVGMVLIFEAITAKFYSFLNAAGDIITLVIEGERHRRKVKQ